MTSQRPEAGDGTGAARGGAARDRLLALRSSGGAVAAEPVDPAAGAGPAPEAEGWVPGDSGDSADSADARPDSRVFGVAGLIPAGSWRSLTERWVPESLRSARVAPGRRGGVVLVAVALLAAAVTAVGLWRQRPAAVPVGAAAVDTAGVEGAGAVDAAAGTVPGDLREAADGRPVGSGDGIAPDGGDVAEGRAAGVAVPAAGEEPATGPILVSVTGAVRRPGLVTLPSDARVADALAAAGGVLDDDDLVGLNLAARLADGDSVVVAGPRGSAVSAESAEGRVGDTGSVLVDLNIADENRLMTLPGVGPVTARAIVGWRDEHGPFAAVEDLIAVPGIGPATLTRLTPLVTV